MSCIQSSDSLGRYPPETPQRQDRTTSQELKMFLAGLEIRVKAAEENVIKSRRAIVRGAGSDRQARGGARRTARGRAEA
jgi:hypothetical protein